MSEYPGGSRQEGDRAMFDGGNKWIKRGAWLVVILAIIVMAWLAI